MVREIKKVLWAWCNLHTLKSFYWCRGCCGELTI